jgi:SAM-dependent methyltransferase
MFSKTAQYYDVIYSWKDYPGEVKRITEIIDREKRSDGNRLLDVACGTGMHMQLLSRTFEVEGLDMDENLMELARERVPGALFHQADMIDFKLDARFDVITCLFSSIGYVKTKENLQRAISCMADHLKIGGVLIIEPWLTPDKIQTDTIHAKFVDEPGLKIARMNTSRVIDGITVFDFDYLIGTPEGIEHFVERHELGNFTVEETMAAFRLAGLEVTYDSDGLMGRGLYTGRRTESLK